MGKTIKLGKSSRTAAPFWGRPYLEFEWFRPQDRTCSPLGDKFFRTEFPFYGGDIAVFDIDEAFRGRGYGCACNFLFSGGLLSIYSRKWLMRTVYETNIKTPYP